MKLNIRKITENDWDTLVSWWDAWPEWVNPPKGFLPDNGTGGLIIEKNNKPIVAGFLYFTNSEAVLLEWIVSDPNYKEKDRKNAIEMLIKGAEIFCKNNGKNYMFSIGRNKHLINIHKKLGWTVDDKSSYEITKQI
jgi:hypothetical protein|tara:strand:+ start:76 stop:483 length:408 start_codon:yes stop_codon:yes gene_type:complete